MLSLCSAHVALGNRMVNSLPRPCTVALDLDRAAVALDEVAHDGQADAEPALRAIDRLSLLDEQIEDVRQHVGRDANAGVAHAQDHFIVDGLAADGNVPARRACTWRRWSAGSKSPG